MITGVGVRMSCLRLNYSPETPLLRPCLLAFHLHLHLHHRQSHRSRRLFSTSCSSRGKKEKVIVISGPTGAGKSKLALELAKRLNGDIINADSVQFYRGLDVGSAKPSLSERKEVPHHLIDILHPSEDYSIGQFFMDTRQATQDVFNAGRVPIVVGGIGLYLRWFEIIKSSGSPTSAFQVPYDSSREKSDSHAMESLDINSSVDGLLKDKIKNLDYEFLCFFLSTQRLDLYRSIDFRCEDMLLGDDGILSEAKWFLDLGLLPNSNSATRAIGYRQKLRKKAINMVQK